MHFLDLENDIKKIIAYNTTGQISEEDIEEALSAFAGEEMSISNIRCELTYFVI